MTSNASWISSQNILATHCNSNHKRRSLKFSPSGSINASIGVRIASKNRRRKSFHLHAPQFRLSFLFPSERKKFFSKKRQRLIQSERRKEKLKNFHIFPRRKRSTKRNALRQNWTGNQKFSLFFTPSIRMAGVILSQPHDCAPVNVVNLKRDRFGAKKDFASLAHYRYFVNFPPYSIIVIIVAVVRSGHCEMTAERMEFSPLTTLWHSTTCVCQRNHRNRIGKSRNIEAYKPTTRPQHESSSLINVTAESPRLLK